MSQTAAAAAAVAAVVATEARWEHSAASQDSQGFTPSELAEEISFGRLAALQDVIPVTQAGIPRPAGDVVKAWKAALDYAHQLTGGLRSSCAVVIASSSCFLEPQPGKQAEVAVLEGRHPWGQSVGKGVQGGSTATDVSCAIYHYITSHVTSVSLSENDNMRILLCTEAVYSPLFETWCGHTTDVLSHTSSASLTLHCLGDHG